MSLPPFQRLLDDHARDVHRFLQATVGREAADDCYQETWLSALAAYPNLTSQSNLRGWLLTIAHRKALDHLRMRERRPVLVADAEGLLPQEADGRPPGPQRQGPAIFDPGQELWDQVRDLPEKQRRAVGMRYLLDAHYREISLAMGISEAAARQNVRAALIRLRKEYSHDLA